MAELNIGPLSFRYIVGGNWTKLQAAFVTNGDFGGARRETVIGTDFKSEHAIALLGKEDKSDSYICPESGEVFYGRKVDNALGSHSLSARQVYEEALVKRLRKGTIEAAQAKTSALEPAAQSTNGVTAAAAAA